MGSPRSPSLASSLSQFSFHDHSLPLWQRIDVRPDRVRYELATLHGGLDHKLEVHRGRMRRLSSRRAENEETALEPANERTYGRANRPCVILTHAARKQLRMQTRWKRTCRERRTRRVRFHSRLTTRKTACIYLYLSLSFSLSVSNYVSSSRSVSAYPWIAARPVAR